MKFLPKAHRLALRRCLQKGYVATGNITYASFNLKEANPNNIAAFNTPKYTTNLSFSNPNAYKGFGFNLAWHWQDAFDWYSTSNATLPGRINAY